ncbi:MAG: GNAT family N-acetyltransferase [Gemmatimonadetes bacterium]|jgi:predicted N-acetyltransferase YhbS|nr:GNAT family N-acetyltransferase [Gemmatimonadota bacterium]
MAGNTVQIRPVKKEDAAQICANCYSANTLEQIEAQLDENIRGAAEGKLVHLVAEVDAQVVGTAILRQREHTLKAHRAEVLGLVVNSNYQRQGIARRLVEECGNRALAMGIEILEIGCRGGEPAEEIYPRLGFIECGRLPRGLRESWGEGKTFDSVRFYKPLK